MEKEKISVIVPVYNKTIYLKHCINSIIDQTYDNLEIIIVNDGSTDKETINILNGLEATDKRIKVINKKNGGVSSARNKGIDNATGNYITFVDADDTIEKDMYQLLFSGIKKYNADICHCGYNRVEGDKIKPVTGTEKIYEQNNMEALTCLLEGRLFVGSLCNKLFKMELFNNVRLDENLKINEDVLACFELFLNAENTVFIDSTKYNYFIYEEISSCCNIDKVKRSKDCLYVAKTICELSKDLPVYKSAKNRYISVLFNEYRFHVCNNISNEMKKNLKAILKSCYKNKEITDKRIKSNTKMILYVPPIYKLIYKVYDKIRKPNWDIVN